MANAESLPFAGLFDLTAPGEGRDVNWTFFEPELNDSARRLLTHVDSLFTSATEPGWVFLTTIENDAECGRFPEVVVNFFAGEFWSNCARFFVAPMAHTLPAPECVVGRLTFETRPAQLKQVLAKDDGFRWGTDLSVGGIQVREKDVAEALTLNPFAPADAGRLEAIARLAWAASRDLDELGLNVAAGNERLLDTIRRIRTA